MGAKAKAKYVKHARKKRRSARGAAKAKATAAKKG